ncbi:MAG: hypothetical protein ACLT3H_12275 [Roseburia sp.]|uniref:Lipoprotein n=1 Tax=Simiaoa sunii TaxID=2763672 RepID=A0A7G9FT12_9FIRM|nr:hypothetical protein [Simiaoa sunii]QNM01694.1 hypothetical protein H9Q77_11370 [Simiaoa sunii]
MKRKQLIAVSILSICLFASACGSNTTDTETIAVVQNTETQQAEIETENEVTESKSDEVKGDTETTEGGTSEATNSEGLTVDEASQADYEYMEEEIYKYYEGDIDTQMAAVKKDYGIDSLCGAWFIYYYGSAAGDQRSYAINQRTGEKIVAGPNSYFYGTSLDDDGATPFYGTDKTYPGDTFPEFEENLTLAIEGKPAHTNGQ